MNVAKITQHSGYGEDCGMSNQHLFSQENTTQAQLTFVDLSDFKSKLKSSDD